ncbi:ABC transporter ATP-binding protein [Corynebacterium liangguodongii]|uniref:ABC transporter ATP-binding protein n=1 Tax=Corynebacterium liangguodongii TaxID=2079535 RepID=A0A2S0WCL4_9CORY|nr:ABC transporter ATP-binding protein [Corynebacterium liangguodongii]AWB83511.1 ABC transporter ATP-binding protein [Corynebacterium liangguodongii]PWC00400.1 ABC transporter ATP-binding protein [Corynebacterium liangguodongii]
MSGEFALEIVDASISRNGHAILRGLNAGFAPGLVHGVIGPNGAGKSTLVKAALGLEEYSGEIRVLGRDLAGLTFRQRARLMSYVAQATDPGIEFTGREYVSMARYARLPRFGSLSRADEEAVSEALRITGATQWANVPVSRTSGGEQQLTAFTRALAQGADLMLLDEPTSALDMGHELDILELLSSWVGGGRGMRTAVVVLHDLSLAARFCDYLTLVVAGRVRAQGTPAEILTPGMLSEAYGVEVDVRQLDTTKSLAVTPLRRIDDHSKGRTS